jgi:hypothetical protein
MHLPLRFRETEVIIETEFFYWTQVPWLLKNDTGREHYLSPHSGESTPTSSSNKRQELNRLFQDCPSCRQWWNFYFNNDRQSSALPAPQTTPQHQMSRDDIEREKAHVQAELNRLESQGDCPSCLWTGVLTCVGLSAYFGNIAWEEYEEIVSRRPPGNHAGPTTESSSSSTITKKSCGKPREASSQSTHEMIKRLQRQRRFGTRPLAFGALSIGWLGLGAYRYHLG